MNREKVYQQTLEEPKRFEGFDAIPRTWDFPTIIDEWVALLSGSEFKCLWYILRHTYGWQKNSDSISLSQFERGIYVKSKCRWLDRGTGLTRETITIALKKLLEKGFIRKIRVLGENGDMEINRYEVVKKNDFIADGQEERSMVGKSDYHGRKIRLEVVRKSDPQSLTTTNSNFTKKDNDATRKCLNGIIARACANKNPDVANDGKNGEDGQWANKNMSDEEKGLIERIIEFTGAKNSTAFYKKAIAELGTMRVEEELAEARYRNNTGKVRNKAKYLGSLLTKQLKLYRKK